MNGSQVMRANVETRTDVSTVEAYPKDIELFVQSLFRYADEGIVSLRTFYDQDQGKPPAKITAVAIEDGLEGLAKAATRDALWASWQRDPLVFCPPTATFKGSGSAREKDLAQGLVLSVECDERAEEIKRCLTLILGPPTLVVASGGEWLNPESGEREPKLHLYWVLKEPTTTSEEHKKLKALRKAAQMLVGADGSNVPVSHPIRWPGSVHRKKTPKLARIVEHNQACEIDLDIALHELQGLVEFSTARTSRDISDK